MLAASVAVSDFCSILGACGGIGGGGNSGASIVSIPAAAAAHLAPRHYPCSAGARPRGALSFQRRPLALIRRRCSCSGRRAEIEPIAAAALITAPADDWRAASVSVGGAALRL